MAISKQIKLAVIDYLQLIENPLKGELRHLQVAACSRTLKRLAIDLNISIVALSQLNKDMESRAGNRISIADLRESEAIGHDADHILFLHRPGYFGEDGSDYLQLAKNRHGPPVSKIPVKWDSEKNSYEEIY